MHRAPRPNPSGRDLGLSIASTLSLALGGCAGWDASGTDRRAGQVELFHVAPSDQALVRPLSPTDPLQSMRSRTDLSQNFGDPIQFSSDVVTLQVHSLYLDDLPATLTGSRDVVVFSEVWENAADAFNATPLTSIVYLGKNQLIPGRMNFSGALAYGPAAYKGTPLKIRFTVMLLQRARGEQQADVAEVISKYASAVPTYGAIASEVVGVIRDMLRAQADVITFDFDAVLASYRPARALGRTGVGSGEALEPLGAARPESRADANADAAWDTFESRTGWLQYGYYALVETRKPRQWSLTGAMHRTVPYDADHRYVLDGSWLLSTAPDHANRSLSERRLQASYIVFSLTPRQIEMTDAFLRAASESNASLLAELRQKEENVASTIASVQAQASRLEEKIVQSRLEVEGHKLATRNRQTPEEFERQFREASASLRTLLGDTWQGTDRDARFESIRTPILSRYREDLASVRQPSDTAEGLRAQLLLEQATAAERSAESMAAVLEARTALAREEAAAADYARAVAMPIAMGTLRERLEHLEASDADSREAVLAAATALEGALTAFDAAKERRARFIAQPESSSINEALEAHRTLLTQADHLRQEAQTAIHKAAEAAKASVGRLMPTTKPDERERTTGEVRLSVELKTTLAALERRIIDQRTAADRRAEAMHALLNPLPSEMVVASARSLLESARQRTAAPTDR